MPVCHAGISKRKTEKVATAANQDFWCTLVLVKSPGLISQDVYEAASRAGLPSNTHHCHPGGSTRHSPTPEPVPPPCWLLSTDAIPLPDSAVSCHAATGEVSPCDATTSDTSSYRQEGKISFISPTALQGSPSLTAATRGSPEPSTPLTQATSHPTPPSPPLLCSGFLHVQERVLPHQVSLPGEGAATFQPCFGFCRSPASGEWHWEKAQEGQLVLNPFLCLFCFLGKKRGITQELTSEVEKQRSERSWALSPLAPEHRSNPQSEFDCHEHLLHREIPVAWLANTTALPSSLTLPT